jgi:hypothetical protein
VLDAQAHVHLLGEPDRLAVVERLELGQLVRVLLHEVGELEHQPRPGCRGQLAPLALERPAGGLNRAIDVLRSGVGDLGDRLAGGRVDRLEGPTVGGVRPLAADNQAVGPRREVAGGF